MTEFVNNLTKVMSFYLYLALKDNKPLSLLLLLLYIIIIMNFRLIYI